MAWNPQVRTTWSQSEDAKLRELLAAGTKPCAIAKALGRNESSVYRRIETLNNRAKTTMRPCMCCGKTFTSDGPHNRLCGACRTRQFSPYAT